MVVDGLAYLVHASEDRPRVMCITFVGKALYVPLRIQPQRSKGFDLSPDDETTVDPEKNSGFIPYRSRAHTNSLARESYRHNANSPRKWRRKDTP